MADEQYVIELEGSDTEAHGLRLGRFTPEGDDEWLQQALRGPGPPKLRIRVAGDADDTEGHRAEMGPFVRVMVETDDDTEGHAISIHFPTLGEADAFRRRLLVTGLIVGTVALGATVGTALADQGSSGAAAGATSVSGEYAADRGAGVAPAAAGAVDEDAPVEQDSRFGPTPR